MITEEKSAVIIVPEGNLPHSQSADPTLYTPHAAKEGTTPVVLEKPSEDGYNWRKYGQKNVKGKEYVRSYYRCSYPHCQAKKQVERSQDGKISDITYLGKHDHPEPRSESREAVPLLLSPQVHTLDCPKPAVSKEKSSNVHPVTDDTKPKEKCELPTVTICYPTTPVLCQLSAEAKDDQNESAISKRRKKSVDGADFTVEKSGHESRHVIRSVSEVDVVNDGYRWRKYGQKMVKGNPNPRSYYRCTTAGCPVKKHVERASHDPKVVITTYEGEHDHSMPPIRTVLPQITAPSAGPTDLNGDGKTKSEDADVALNDTACKAEKNCVTDPTAKQESYLARMVETKPEVTSGEHGTQGKDEKTDHVDQTSDEESDQTMDDPICKGSNSDHIDHSSKQEEIGSSDQDNKGKNQKTEEQSDQKMDDPIRKDSISDKTDRSSKQEENVLQNDVKMEDLSTDQQRTDTVLDKTYHEEKSNGEPRMSSEAAHR